MHLPNFHVFILVSLLAVCGGSISIFFCKPIQFPDRFSQSSRNEKQNITCLTITCLVFQIIKSSSCINSFSMLLELIQRVTFTVRLYVVLKMFSGTAPILLLSVRSLLVLYVFFIFRISLIFLAVNKFSRAFLGLSYSLSILNLLTLSFVF